ncbi:MAG: ABC transporter permease [Dermatophilaceae bacterium]
MSAPAQASSRIRAQSRFELVTLLANGEQLLVSLVLPVMALLGLAYSTVPSLGEGPRIDLAVPGVLGLCVISAAFTSQAIATGFDRRYAVLRLLGTTPLGREGLLAAKASATLGVEVVQLVVIGAVGWALGWRPVPVGLVYAVPIVLSGTWAFVALALLLAGTVRAEGVLALANLLWVLMLVIGGVVVPRTELPPGLAAVVAWLPSAALGDALRAALAHGQFAAGAFGILLAWAVAGTALAARFFRWSD